MRILDFIKKGKKTFYLRELRRTYEAVQPAKMFAKDASLGFRDICLQIVKILKEGRRIAIIDENECKKTRLSYIKLLQKKCDSMSVAMVSILPQYGCEQLFWTRELRLAAESSVNVAEDCNRSEISLSDASLTKWFSKDSDLEIHYRHGIVEKPSEAEECAVYEKHVGIYTKSMYKFEVPVVFLQWEVICGLTTNNHKMTKLAKALELWSGVNPCGRVIVICDGSQIHTGEKTKAQQQKDIDNAMASLTSQFMACPVYVFHLVDPKQAGGYVVPPKPGILAFLQQRHCLNLHSRRSVYMYETSCHMKMAENAGVRHIKASRVTDHPSLVISSHAACTPSIPEMLKTKKILPVQSSLTPALIPLAQLRDAFVDGRVQQNLPYGRSEYMYVADLESMQRYNELYSKSATEVGKSGSKMSPKKPCHAIPNKSSTSQVPASNVTADQSGLSIVSRDLPKWMVKKDRSNESRSSVEVSQSDDGLQTEKKIRKTMYVMTEKELVEVACDILKQAGKNDIVERFLIKSDQESDKGPEDKKTEIPLKCVKTTSKRKPSSYEKTSNRKHYQDKRTKTRNDKTDALDDIGEQLGSLCPKMEPDSDLEENSMNSSIKEDSDDHIRSDKTELSEAHKDKGRNKISEDDVDNGVANVLDDFSASHVASKPSPIKRTRIKNEPVFTNRSPSKQRHLDKSVSNLDQIDFQDRRNVQSKKSNVRSNEKPTDMCDDSGKEDTIKKRKTRHTPDMSHLDDIF